MAKPKQKRKPSTKTEVVRRIVVSPFNYTLEVVVSKSVQESAHKRSIPITRNFAAAHCGAADQPFSYMFLPLDVPMSVMAHEVFHCVWHIMEIIGADHENEVMAYTLSFLIDEIGPMVMAARKTLGFVPTKNAKLA